MKIDQNEKRFILILILLSVLLYVVHYLVFRDLHHIFIYGLGDLAFIPLEVIFVSLILHRVLEANEKRKQIRKLYMVIEIFFSEVGTKILRIFSRDDQKFNSISEDLQIQSDWTQKQFARLKEIKRNYQPDVRFDQESMETTRDILIQQRDFLIKLIENPILLEHETFTELLMAVFHFGEELRCRMDLGMLPSSDQEHLAKDAQRVYALLGYEWVDYMEHMQENYPYLFNFSIRINPFNQEDDIIVK